MATTIVCTQATCPAGHVFSDGPVQSVNVGPDPVIGIRWRIPPGPQGLLEWWLGQSGVPVFPNAQADGVIGDNEWDTWAIDNPPSNPVWQVFCNNQGTLDHVLEFQFYIETFTGGGGGPVDLTALFPQNDLAIPTMFLA